MEYIKSSQGSNVLLILDGWNELQLSCHGEDMFFPKLVKGDILPNCSFVITSRFGPTDFIKYQAPIANMKFLNFSSLSDITNIFVK